MAKLGRWIVLLILAALVVSCGVAESDDPAPRTEEPEQTFTLEELKEFNGQDGNRAFIAVDGIVYDVTDVPQWRDGSHRGVRAGADVTEALTGAPHGFGVLDRAEVIGRLTEE